MFGFLHGPLVLLQKTSIYRQFCVACIWFSYSQSDSSHWLACYESQRTMVSAEKYSVKKSILFWMAWGWVKWTVIFFILHILYILKHYTFPDFGVKRELETFCWSHCLFVLCRLRHISVLCMLCLWSTDVRFVVEQICDR